MHVRNNSGPATPRVDSQQIDHPCLQWPHLCEEDLIDDVIPCQLRVTIPSRICAYQGNRV
ncbi:hypothetical protein M758_11G167800 [Ceratodon purpureus]|uniref:Uncharacterized protein n=1 Tax=Ceratodon purpureus TaxID=3225 RepID=A0A8T0GG73_CERPU|nr:hypothetical protein KC19_N007800 [Ceratodon purpureus]KAG0558003.1 hypothetical protein KC19_11G171900 [Ceratodon purpureus]KAG0602210.1 hypothetical protein M758_11G167800 [Ceratodon purpureus]